MNFKKKMLCIVAAALMVLGALPLSSCSANAPKGTLTRMTVDINPSVELMIDDENKVVSATALNDDGSILIAGEALVGKSPEEAAELIVSLSCDTGYLVKGTVEADNNTVKISVSGNTAYAEKLCERVQDRVAGTLERLDIEGKVEKVEAIKLDALRALAADSSAFTEEEVKDMTEQELYRVLAVGRIETALLLTEELRDAYYSAKEHEIAFVERETTAKIIAGMGTVYTLIHAGYNAALEAYGEAIKRLDDFRYDTFVSPESDYQKSLAELREAKTELLSQRSYVATLDINGAEYASAKLTLQGNESAYNAALAVYEGLGAAANTTLEGLASVLRSCESALISAEEHFSDSITEELTARAEDVENAVNTAKDEFFAAFEAAHKDDIEASEAALKARKQALIDSLK